MPLTLTTGIDHTRPLSVTHTSKGETFMANGTDKPRRWNPYDLTVENAGVIPATLSTMTITAGATGGAISGTYYVALRFIDDEGIPGDLSAATAVILTNTTQIDYGTIHVPTDARVTSKQIWRSTAGQATTFYLDKTISKATTAATSTAIDSVLSLNTSLAILNLDGTLSARRFGVPPDFKAVVVSHQDRTFWGVNPVVDDGHARTEYEVGTVTIYGAHLTSQLVGRKFYVPNHSTVHDITSVTPSGGGRVGGTIIIDPIWADTGKEFTRYAIRVEPDEANRIYFSELAEPESVPTVNAVDIVLDESDGGPVTAIMPMGSFLWIFTPHRCYRWTYQVHPLNDGAVYLTAYRGSINQNCWVQTEGNAFVMDREGIYMFNGGTVQNVTDPIADMFRPGGGISWANAKWFHAREYVAEDTIRFFVSLDGSQFPRHAICYQYRAGAIWTEEFPWRMTSSTTTKINKHPRLVCGSRHGKVYLLNEGQYDGPTNPVVGRVKVTASDVTHATVTGHTFTASDILFSRITIVRGTGKGQTRTIVAANATTGEITINEPWVIRPDSNSWVQIAGVPYTLKTKWFRLLDVEAENSRRCYLSFAPTLSTCTIDVSALRDYSRDPTAYRISYDRADGARVARDQDDVEIDTKTNKEGWAYWSFDDQHDLRGPAPRFIQLRIRGTKDGEPIKIYTLQLDGVR